MATIVSEKDAQRARLFSAARGFGPCMKMRLHTETLADGSHDQKVLAAIHHNV